MELKSKTWTQISEYLESSDTIIIPIGAIEQHGPSCPLYTDSLIAEYLAIKLGSLNNILVAPTISLGDSLIHLQFPGTISLKPTTLIAVVKDVVSSLYKSGFRRFLVVNGHGDNYGSITVAFSELGDELSKIRYFIKDFWDFPSFRGVMNREFGDPNGGHADSTDASILLAIDDSLVNKDLYAREFASVNYWVSGDLIKELYTKSGVINADQSMAKFEIGVELIEESLKGYTDILIQLSK